MNSSSNSRRRYIHFIGKITGLEVTYSSDGIHKDTFKIIKIFPQGLVVTTKNYIGKLYMRY